MVKVKVERKDYFIQRIVIQDHAGYADAGFDLVCAGVSSISVGMMNALDQLIPDVCDFTMRSAYVEIRLKQRNEQAQLLLEAMLIQLKTLENNYNSYIKIKDQEV